jgi:predicted DNA-binding transcriptional regulator YafY
MAQAERIWRIQHLLRDGVVVPKRLFLEELGISPAQFKRDLSFLRDRFQVEIDYNRERRGYRRRVEKADAEIALPGPLYTPAEIEALLIMQDLMDQLQPGLLENYIKPLRERLKLLLGNKDLRSEQIRRRIRILHMASRPVRPKFFREVSRATLDRRRLVIRYYTRDRDESLKREISPQRLVYYRGNWYLDAWCHLRQDLRSFAVDAVEAVSETKEVAHEIKTEALNANLGAGYGIFAGPARESAVLRFKPFVARWVAAEQWHAKQILEREPDGHLILTVPYANEPELIMDILRYGPDVEVLSPESLKQAVRKRLKDALAMYSK